MLLALGILPALARPATAFVTACHQGITTDALGAGLWPLGADDWSLGALLGNEYEDVGPYDATAAGVSLLNFDTWAAQSGSLGPYFAISPLGVGIRMGGHLRLLIDPAEIAFEIPQTAGIPFIYREHRFTVAVQANF